MHLQLQLQQSSDLNPQRNLFILILLSQYLPNHSSFYYTSKYSPSNRSISINFGSNYYYYSNSVDDFEDWNGAMHHDHVDSFAENCWCDVIDYSSLLDDGAPPAGVYQTPPPPSENVCMSIDVSPIEVTAPVIKSEERGFKRKRGSSDLHGRIGTKAGRERERRGKLNDRFLELSAILKPPERPVKTEKLAILSDAIRLLNQLKTESQEYTERNKRLIEEIKVLKVEKNELREEKLNLKEAKERMEQQLNTMNISPIGFTASHPPMYEAEVKKVPMLPSYGFVPMWQYLSPSVRDTAQDHVLRPPAA